MKQAIFLDKKRIGERLKNTIKEAGYTQKDFADTAGIALSTLKKYINGETYFTIDVLHIFSMLTECTYEYLLCQSDIKYPSYTNNDIEQDKYLSDSARNELRHLTANAQKGCSEERIRMYALDKLLTNRNVLCYIADYLQIPIDIDYHMLPAYTDSLYRTSLGDLPISIKDLPELYLLRIRESLIALRSTLNAAPHKQPAINEDFIPYSGKLRGKVKAWLHDIKDI